jgi:hypothetical protein
MIYQAEVISTLLDAKTRNHGQFSGRAKGKFPPCPSHP